MKAAASEPVTKEVLKDSLAKLGVGSNQILEVHADLSAFDYVVGGARTVVDALLEIAGDSGTVLMPAMAFDNREPSTWRYTEVPAGLYREVRDAIPAYTENSDRYGIGSVGENFRHRDGVVCSRHPSASFAAWGRYAKLLCNHQSLHFPLAQESPCARLYELKGYVLLLGCDFDRVTCMHLAEYRTDSRPIRIEGAAVEQDGMRTWEKYLDLQLDSSVFLQVKNSMLRKNMIRQTMLSNAVISFFPVAFAVDETAKYLEKTVVYDLYR